MKSMLVEEERSGLKFVLVVTTVLDLLEWDVRHLVLCLVKERLRPSQAKERWMFNIEQAGPQTVIWWIEVGRCLSESLLQQHVTHFPRSASNLYAEQCLLSHSPTGKALPWKWKLRNNEIASHQSWSEPNHKNPPEKFLQQNYAHEDPIHQNPTRAVWHTSYLVLPLVR